MTPVNESKSEPVIPVGMAELSVTNHPNSCLTTSLLGAGIAVAVHDPESHVGGLLHFVLPRWSIDKESALDNPALFADSGIPALYKRCYKMGAEKERMKCYLIGGANVMDRTGGFNLGKDNLDAATDILAKNGVSVEKTWSGGIEGRVIRFHTDGGRVDVQIRGQEKVA